MKSRYSTGILLALVAAVVAYAYFVEYKGGLKKAAEEDSQKIILDFEKKDVTKVRIKNSKGEFIFDKSSGQWLMTSPESNLADATQVENLISQIVSEKYEEKVAEGADIKPEIYGLTDASARVELEIPGVKKELLIGTETSVANKKYVKLSDENTVLLASPMWEYLMTRDLNELVSKDLVPKKDNIQKIKITNPKGELNFELAEGQWKLLQLKTDDLDKDAINQVHNYVKSLKAQKYFAANTKDAATVGLNHAPFKLHITYADTSTVDVSVTEFNKNKDAYAQSSDRKGLFFVNEYTAGFIMKGLEDFRDRARPFKFSKDEVKEISYRSSLFTLHIKKENDIWTSVEALKGRKVDSLEAETLINRIAGLRVKRFFDKPVELQPSGLNELKLMGDNAKELLTLKWGARPLNDIFVVASSLEKFPVAVDISELSSLPFQAVVVEEAPPVDPKTKDEVQKEENK